MTFTMSGDWACKGSDADQSQLGRCQYAAWHNARKNGIVTTMKGIKIDTTIDEAVVHAIPALRPLLGRHVEFIALDAAPPRGHELTVDEFLAARIKLPTGASPVSLEAMERAIAEGALGR